MCPLPITQLGIMSAGVLIPLQERVYRQKTTLGSFPEARLYPMILGSLWVVYFVARCCRSTSLVFTSIFRVLPAASRLPVPMHGFTG